MTFATHRALRTSAVYTRHGRGGPAIDLLQLRGEGARDAVLRLCTSRLQLRDGQAQQCLLLRDDGTILADATVCADDEDYLLVIERGGLLREDLLEHVRRSCADVPSLTIEDASLSHDVVSLHGPFAWELVADVLGQDLVALPYLNFFRLDEGLALRSGKTGEFGYELLLRRDRVDQVWARIEAAAPRFDALPIDEGALALGRFEGWFFDPSVSLPALDVGPATPIELQLQWRLSARDFVGKQALTARKAQLRARPEVSLKLACVVMPRPASAGALLQLDDAPVGVLHRSAVSPVADLAFGAAFLPEDLARSGLELRLPDGGTARVVAPPLLDNRSLYVDPRRHGYQTRDEIKFGAFSRLSPAEAAA